MPPTYCPGAGEDRQGYHWHEIYQHIVEQPLTAEDTSRISYNYAQNRDLLEAVPAGSLVEDPLVTSASKVYEDLVPLDPLVAITRVAEAALRISPGTAPEKSRALGGTKRASFWSRILERRATRKEARDKPSLPLYLDHPPLRFLHDRLSPGSALDLGSRSGGYLESLKGCGVDDLFAVSGFAPPTKERFPEEFLQHNLEAPLDLHRQFDLVISLEMVDQIDPAHEEIALDSIERHCRGWILFSAADQGQTGKGHINSRPISYWLEAWEKRGFVPDAFASLAFRSLATFSWLRRNPIVLARQGVQLPESAFCTDDLLRIGGCEPSAKFGHKGSVI